MAVAAHGVCSEALKRRYALAAPRRRAVVDTAPPHAAKRPAQHRFFDGLAAPLGRAGPYRWQGDETMAEYNQATYDAVADIIAEVSSIDRATIVPDSHAINDLGIDSLDFLDVTFAIDKKFGIKMPVEKWMEDVNEGRAKAEEFFVMRNLVRRIDELVAQKATAA
jgi:acyl carrier protein